MNTPEDNARKKELLQVLVNNAYHCGHNHAPSFCVPDAEKVFGYKDIIELFDQYESKIAEMEEQIKQMDATNLDLHHEYKCLYEPKISALQEKLKTAKECLEYVADNTKWEYELNVDAKPGEVFYDKPSFPGAIHVDIGLQFRYLRNKAKAVLKLIEE